MEDLTILKKEDKLLLKEIREFLSEVSYIKATKKFDKQLDGSI